jgi:hypothetical protein
MSNQTEYNVVVACYGGRRGTTLATLTQARLNEMHHEGLDIKVLGRGHEKFIGNKAGEPVSDEHISAVEKAAVDYKGNSVQVAISALRKTGRKVATSEELQAADAVYAVDSFVLGQYQKVAGETESKHPSVLPKYQTVLTGAGIQHKIYGADMDDTETSADFTNRVIVPKKQGLPGEKLSTKDAKYFAMNGTEYRAGDEAARLHEAKDLVEIADFLAERILADAECKSKWAR